MQRNATKLIKIIFFVAILSFAIFPTANAQFWDSWTDTYSPTWTPLSLDQMTSKSGSSGGGVIKTYTPTVTAPTSDKPAPPSDFVVPEGGVGVRINKYTGAGSVRYLSDNSNLPWGTLPDFDARTIVYKPDSLGPIFLVGTITHYNAGSYSFGYIHPDRLKIDVSQYKAISDAVIPPADFTIPSGAIGVRIKEWGRVQYLNNNATVSGAKGVFQSAKIMGSIINENEELGVITANNYKKYDNVDSFGYIYPHRLYYAFSRGKGENNMSPAPQDLVVPEGARAVRVGDWGSVYYLDTNELVSDKLVGQFRDPKTGTSVPESMQFIDLNDTSKTGIGKISHFTEDSDVYSFGYIFPEKIGQQNFQPQQQQSPQRPHVSAGESQKPVIVEGNNAQKKKFLVNLESNPPAITDAKGEKQLVMKKGDKISFTFTDVFTAPQDDEILQKSWVWKNSKKKNLQCKKIKSSAGKIFQCEAKRAGTAQIYVTVSLTLKNRAVERMKSESIYVQIGEF